MASIYGNEASNAEEGQATGGSIYSAGGQATIPESGALLGGPAGGNATDPGGPPGAPKPALTSVSHFCGLVSVDLYKPLFNVDTEDVKSRLKFVLFPFKRQDTFLDLIKGNPDLYGPLWVSTTVLFALAITSTLSSWTHFHRGSPTDIWTYDFHLVVLGATIVYGFVGICPTALWAVLHYMSVPSMMLIELFCLYGYSMAVFVPITFLCLVPSRLLMFFLLAGATAISFLPVLQAAAKCLVHLDPKAALKIKGFMLFMHMTFALTLFFIFYGY